MSRSIYETLPHRSLTLQMQNPHLLFSFPFSIFRSEFLRSSRNLQCIQPITAPRSQPDEVACFSVLRSDIYTNQHTMVQRALTPPTDRIIIAQPSRLIQLPGDIKNMIFTHALPTNQLIILHNVRESPDSVNHVYGPNLQLC